MYVGQTKQFLNIKSNKLKTQHNLATSKVRCVMGAKPPYPVENSTTAQHSTTNTPGERIPAEKWVYELNENAHYTQMSRDPSVDV